MAHAITARDRSPPKSINVDQKQSHCILIVEDSKPELARLNAILTKQGHQVIEAVNGKEALELLDQHDVSLILTDWHMPVLSGLELCKKVNERKLERPYLLLLTSRSATCDLVSAMDAGADDYLAKPFDAQELRARVRSGLRIKEMQKTLSDNNQVLKQSLDREKELNLAIEQELQAAASFQKTMLPQKFVPINGVSISHFFQAAQWVAGDIYSVLPLGERYIAFYLVDVVGHGVRSAMLSYAVARFLLEHSKHPPLHKRAVQMQSPKNVLKSLNNEFSCNNHCTDYFTIVYGVLDTLTGKGKVAQAGHPYPKLLKSTGTFTRLEAGGLPIGLFPNSNYEEQSFQLELDDMLILYSDGIYECETSTGEAYTDKRLEALLKPLRNQKGHGLQETLDKRLSFASNNTMKDDISFLIIQLNQQTSAFHNEKGN